MEGNVKKERKKTNWMLRIEVLRLVLD